ncbi:MAG: IS30 family transposase [Minisyncoccia bacterium]
MTYQHLSVEDREEIQKGLWKSESIRSIAERLGRSAASISREIRKNQTPIKEQYSPRLADAHAEAKRKSRGRKDRLKNETVRQYVIQKLKIGWSPEQISGTIEIEKGECISHEAIYQYIYAQVHRGGNGWVKPGKEDLRLYLARRHKKRAKKGMRKGERIFKLNGPSIDGRPRAADLRSRIGDWEGDSIESKDHAPGLNSLVDRKSGLLLLSKLRAKSAEATREVVSKRLADLPSYTLTVDNGPENRTWEETERSAGVKVYFAHPYHSWERGTNENTNGLVRRYFPKGTDFREVSEDEIARVEYALNTRPRKRLGYRSPLEVFNQSVALQC